MIVTGVSYLTLPSSSISPYLRRNPRLFVVNTWLLLPSSAPNCDGPRPFVVMITTPDRYYQNSEPDCGPCLLVAIALLKSAPNRGPRLIVVICLQNFVPICGPSLIVAIYLYSPPIPLQPNLLNLNLWYHWQYPTYLHTPNRFASALYLTFLMLSLTHESRARWVCVICSSNIAATSQMQWSIIIIYILRHVLRQIEFPELRRLQFNWWMVI